MDGSIWVAGLRAPAVLSGMIPTNTAATLKEPDPEPIVLSRSYSRVNGFGSGPYLFVVLRPSCFVKIRPQQPAPEATGVVLIPPDLKASALAEGDGGIHIPWYRYTDAYSDITVDSSFREWSMLIAQQDF
ncbi:hypothetical protein UY3_04147 [Chelonia mydas]|uniref:Uncharacterized protein n=1 Tax=Chelonia mydas TaxID=8469 RepID=M7BL92_CHEMY|nr:hypothetical protein UY3_04147 [Chelonia mydas]